MFLRVLNTVFLNKSNYMPHLELRNRSIQFVIITNFVVIWNVSIMRFDCTNLCSKVCCWKLKFLHGTGDKNGILKQLKWKSLKYRRKLCMFILLYLIRAEPVLCLVGVSPAITSD